MKSLAFVSMSALATVLAAPAMAQQADGAVTPPVVTVPEETVADAPVPLAEEDIVVTGLRRSVASAQAIKRDAVGIVDAIVAEDIGKLPDVTASAALARVTGVQVTRGAGEAAGVQIRGLPDISTTYNGREIFTAEGRSVAIQDFPAGMVGALEVYKSSTANLIEPGIGGQVNVRGRRPFDFKGFTISGALNGLHYEQSQALDWNGSLLVSDRFETGIGEMGFLVNASMTNIDYIDATREGNLEVNTVNGVTRPNGQGVFVGHGDRWRPSVSAAFQWQATPELQVYVDGLFQGYRAKDDARWMSVPMANGVLTNVVNNPDGTLKSATVTGADRPSGYDQFVKARTNTYQVGGGVEYKGDRLKVTADVAYTDSRYTQNQANIDFGFTSSPVRNIDFDVSRGVGGSVFEFVNFDASDPRNYNMRGLFETNREATGKDLQARIDVEYETGIPWLKNIQVGARYNNRDAGLLTGTRYRSNEAAGVGYTDLPVTLAPITRGFRYDTLQSVTQFTGPTFDSVFDNLDALRTLVGFPTGPVPYAQTEAFTANERAIAGYAQVNYAFDIGIPVDGAIGLRAVNTRTRVNGTSLEGSPETGTYTPISQTSEYTDFLPNASIRFGLTNELQLRLNYTQTRTRPNYVQLNPSRTVSTLPSDCTPTPNVPGSGPDNENCFQTINGGNPNLQALQADNYDISLEYYFSRTGSLTLAAFQRDTRNFIFNTMVEQELPGAPDIRYNSPVNGGKGRIRGIEAAFTTFFDFDFLPDWAKGFGVQANYTFIDGKTELSPNFQDVLPGQQPIPNVSKHNYNLVAFYEKQQFAARLAYNWRSKFVMEYSDLNGVKAPFYQDDLGTLDFTASVTPVENVTFVFDMLNILAQPIETYRAHNAAGDYYRFQTRYLERVYSFGVRFRF